MRKLGARSAIFAIVAAAIFLSALLRFHRLSQKLFWVDEVASSLRVTGITDPELRARYVGSEGTVLTGTELRGFVRPGADTRASAVIGSLAAEDSQHAPLFPILQFHWVRAFGADPGTMRALSAVFGALLIVSVFLLGLELTGDAFSALVGASVAAVSPLQLVYAQQAREYSAWASVAALASICVLRAARTGRTRDWTLYAFLMTVCLYTAVPSVFVLAAHGAGLICARRKSVLIPFATSAAASLLLFMPWARVILGSLDTIAGTNKFTALSISAGDYVTMLVLNFGRIVYDDGVWSTWDRPLHWGWNRMPMLFGASLAALGCVAALRRFRCERGDRYFLATLLIVPFAPWFVADIISGGKRALVLRYLMPCSIAIEIGLGILISEWVRGTGFRKFAGWGALTGTLVLGFFSAEIYFRDRAWWTTRPPQLAVDLSEVSPAATIPRIIADSHSGWSLISLAETLPATIEYVLASDAAQVDAAARGSAVWIFSDSPSRLAALTNGRVTENVGSGKYLKSMRLPVADR